MLAPRLRIPDCRLWILADVLELGVLGKVPQRLPEEAVLPGDTAYAIARLDHVIALSDGLNGCLAGGLIVHREARTGSQPQAFRRAIRSWA